MSCCFAGGCARRILKPGKKLQGDLSYRKSIIDKGNA